MTQQSYVLSVAYTRDSCANVLLGALARRVGIWSLLTRIADQQSHTYGSAGAALSEPSHAQTTQQPLTRRATSKQNSTRSKSKTINSEIMTTTAAAGGLCEASTDAGSGRNYSSDSHRDRDAFSAIGLINLCVMATALRRLTRLSASSSGNSSSSSTDDTICNSEELYVTSVTELVQLALINETDVFEFWAGTVAASLSEDYSRNNSASIATEAATNASSEFKSRSKNTASGGAPEQPYEYDYDPIIQSTLCFHWLHICFQSYILPSYDCVSATASTGGCWRVHEAGAAYSSTSLSSHIFTKLKETRTKLLTINAAVVASLGTAAGASSSASSSGIKSAIIAYRNRHQQQQQQQQQLQPTLLEATQSHVPTKVAPSSSAPSTAALTSTPLMRRIATTAYISSLVLEVATLRDSIAAESAAAAAESLSQLCADLDAIVSCAMFERLVDAAVTSAVAFISKLQEALKPYEAHSSSGGSGHASSSGSLSSSGGGGSISQLSGVCCSKLSGLLRVCLRLLISVPAPWAGHSNAETGRWVRMGRGCLNTLLLHQSSRSVLNQAHSDSGAESNAVPPVMSNAASAGTAVAKFDARIQRYEIFNQSLITSASAAAAAVVGDGNNSTRLEHRDDGWYEECRQLSRWSASDSRRLPAFVINLDRRPDRWRNILLQAESRGLVCVRVSAVDGRRAALTEASDPCTAVAACLKASESSSSTAVSHIADRLTIPLSDVSEVWDSTLNHKFDPTCLVNQHTLMTHSERACAASHLMVWRMIHNVRQQLFGMIDKNKLDVSGISSSTSELGSHSSSCVASTRSKRSKDAAATATATDIHISSMKTCYKSSAEYATSLRVLAVETVVSSYLGGGWRPLPLPHTRYSSSGKRNLNDNKVNDVHLASIHNGSSSDDYDVNSYWSHLSGFSKMRSPLAATAADAAAGATGPVLSADTDWYLILEDDAAFITTGLHNVATSKSTATTAAATGGGTKEAGDFMEKLNELLQRHVPDDFDICYLGYVHPFQGKLEVVNKYVYRTDYAWQLHSYIIRGRAITKILSHLPVSSPVDNFIAQLIYDGYLVAYVLKTKLMTQAASEISAHHFDSSTTSNRALKLSDSNIQHSGRVSAAADHDTNASTYKNKRIHNKNKR